MIAAMIVAAVLPAGHPVTIWTSDDCPPCRQMFAENGYGTVDMPIAWEKSPPPAWVTAWPAMESADGRRRIGYLSPHGLREWSTPPPIPPAVRPQPAFVPAAVNTAPAARRGRFVLFRPLLQPACVTCRRR